jgi:hypothetical protein
MSNPGFIPPKQVRFNAKNSLFAFLTKPFRVLCAISFHPGQKSAIHRLPIVEQFLPETSAGRPRSGNGSRWTFFSNWLKLPQWANQPNE